MKKHIKIYVLFSIKNKKEKRKHMEKNQENNETQEIKTLSPKLDVIFQAIFGEVGSEKITKGFLETVLKQKIETIDLSKNPILRQEFKEEKLGVLDIIAELDGKEKCNIELQIVDKSNIIERILFYWSRLYSRQIKAGTDYEKLERTIVVLITDFEIKGLEEAEYHSRWKIMESENNKRIILTEKLEIDILELPKIKGKEENKDKVLDWLYFLENPKSWRVTKKMEENEELKEAVEKLDTLSADERMRRIAELREKAILDEKAIYARGIEVGEEQGIKQGMKQGMKQGVEQGELNKSKEIARNMLKEKISIEIIVKVTGLSKEQIEKL